MTASGLVGRRAELTRIGARLDAVAAGRGGLVLLSGEPGIGKSVLAGVAAEQAADRGVAVAWGRCRETEGAPAYWPWTQVLAQLPDVDPDPVLRPLLGGVAQGDGDRFRLFDAAAGLLIRIAERRPVLVVLDDLHRADEASLALLRFVVPALTRAPLLVLGTYRSTEVPPSHPLGRLLAEAAGDIALEVVELAGLSREDTAALVAELGEGGGIDVDGLHERTAGNPFFLTELIRLVPADPVRLPVTVDAAIRARVAQLDGATAALLGIASVLGRDVDPAPLALLAGGPEADIVPLLEGAVAAGLLSARPDGPGYRFRHVLVREALYAGRPADERARLHERAVAVLERTGGDDPSTLAQLAHHAERAARLPGGRERALARTRAAARGAAAQMADEQAADWYSRALALGPQDDERATLLLELGSSAGRAGRPVDARRAFDEAWSLAVERSDTGRAVQAALGLGEVVVSAGTVDAGLVRMLEQTLRILGPDDGTQRVRLTARLATELYWGSGLHRARALAAEADATARAGGDPGALAAALAARQFVLRGPDGLAARLRLGRELVDLAVGLGDDELELGARRMLVPDLLQSDPIEAQAEIDALAHLAATSRRPLAQWYVLLYRTTRAAMAGRPAARALVDSALALGRRIRAQPASIYACGHRVMLRSTTADPGLEDEVRRLAARYPVLAVFRCLLALLLAETGRTDEAAALLDELTADRCAPLPPDSLWLASVGVLTETAARLDDAEHADVLLTLLAPYSGRVAMLGVTAWTGAVDRPLALAAAALGRWDDAERWFDAALRTHVSWGATPLVAQTLTDHAAMLRRRGVPGDRQRATRLTTEADFLGSGRPAAAPREPDGLTAREGEVLDLLAGGASNKEIAGRLHLSVHTVERHVANVYAKINARNRAEATAVRLRGTTH